MLTAVPTVHAKATPMAREDSLVGFVIAAMPSVPRRSPE